MLIVRLGDIKYRLERNWAQMPDGTQLQFVSEVACGPDGRVHLVQRSDPPVWSFLPDGKLQRSFGTGIVDDAHGISVTRAGDILVVDRDHHFIQVFDRDGNPKRKIGHPDNPNWQKPFNHPTDVTEGPDGSLWVVDGYANACFHKFSADGVYQQTWGKPGKATGCFCTPHGVLVDSRGRVLVADQDNDRIQVFDYDGRYLDQWTGFYHPMDLAALPDGSILVTDETPKLSRLSLDGEVLGACRPARYVGHGISVDPSGRVFIAESAPVNALAVMIPL